MTIEKALLDMLSEYSIEEILEMLELFSDSYLETSEGGVNMKFIYRQRALEKFLKDSHRLIQLDK